MLNVLYSECQEEEVVAHLREVPEHASRSRSFNELCVPYIGEMKVYARSLTKDGSWADDVVQDSMLRAWRAWERFVPDPTLGTPRDAARAWLYKIVTYTFRLHITKREREARYECDFTQDKGDVYGHESEVGKSGKYASGRWTPASRFVPLVHFEIPGNVMGDEVLAAIARLPPEQREIIELRCLKDLSLPEIQERLGVATSEALRTRLFRARAALTKILRTYAQRQYRITGKRGGGGGREKK